MEDLEQVYLIASFPDRASLERAARALNLPAERLVILGNPRSGAADLAASLKLGAELNDAIPLDDGQRKRLAWHLEHTDRPLLAARVLASNGREVRLNLTELGGEMLWAPGIATQVNDLDVDPGMATPEPELPPSYGRLSDAITPGGEADV